MSETVVQIRKILQNEITQLITIIIVVYTFVVFVILPIKSLQQDIDNIKTNHLHTIQMDMAEVKVLNTANTKDNNDAHNKIMQELIKTATILDEHLKK